MKEAHIQVGDLQFKPYISHEDIIAKVKTLAVQLTEQYHDKNPLFVVVLTGGFRFAADIANNIDFPCEWCFIKTSSYQGLSTTGNVHYELKLPEGKVTGRHVIIVEDIVETGITLKDVETRFLSEQPASLTLVALFYKPNRLQTDIQVDMCGFVIDDLFIVGYGLDYNGHGRELNDIYQIVNEC